MIWDGVEHGERIQEPFKTNVTRGSWWQTDSYKLQISYEMYKDNITLATVSLDKCHVGFTLSRSPMSEVTYLQPAPSSGALLCQYSQPRSVDIQTVIVLAHHKLTLSSNHVCCSSDSEVIPNSKEHIILAKVMLQQMIT